MAQVFDTLLLLALPASGKSEVRTFLHEVLDNLKFAEHPRWFRA